MLTDTFLILLPLILLALGGYVLSAVFSLSEDTLIRIVTDFFMPALIFYALYTSDIDITETLKLLGSVSFVLGVLFAVSFLYCRLFKIDFRAFSPPVLFMNSGFLGIPLMKLWGGTAAMTYIVIYDQIQTFFIFTLGIGIVTGGFTLKGLREMAVSPLLWSIVAGFVFRYANIPVWPNLVEAIGYCGSGAPALAIFALGCSLRKRKVVKNVHLPAGLCLRFGFGFAAGWAATKMFGITGMERTVVMVASSLPSAVFSVVLPLRYKVDAGLAGSLVLASTLMGMLTIPLVFFLAAL